jgi:SAM-dependent methyltransferase
MPDRADPFAELSARYEIWFERYRGAYVSELLAVRTLLPYRGLGIEIGVGSGRFAAPLGVQVGMDPSGTMLKHAQARGTAVAMARAEALPFRSATFDYALVVTTICFVSDPGAMLSEAHRVLRGGGRLVIGAVDRDSPLGHRYVATQADNPFYRHATFYSADEIERLVLDAGFAKPVWVQTLPRGLEPGDEIHAVDPGRGSGAFVVVQAVR